MNSTSLKNINNNLSIKNKLIILIIILLSYSTLVTGFLGYKWYSKTYEDNMVRNSRDNSVEIISQLNTNIENINSLSQQILYGEFIYDTYMQLMMNDKMDSIEIRNLKVSFEQYLQSILISRTDSDAVIFRFLNKNMDFFVSKNYADHSYSRKITDILINKLQNSSPGPIWYIDNEDPKGSAIYHARLVYNRNTGEPIGLFAYKINILKFFNIFKDFSSHRNQNIYLYDETNKQILDFENFSNTYEDSINFLLDPNTETGIYVKQYENDKFYFVYNNISMVNWKVCEVISTKILLTDLRKIVRTVILLCIISLPIWIILIDYLYVSIIKPLNKLVRSMRQIEAGNIGTKIDLIRKDEFGFLYQSFNKMSAEIENLINTVYREELAMKDAEIKALQAQINPHFLYNTLEAIKWKARIHGVKEIDEMVSALSTIIDANLNRTNEKFISIHQELNYLENYILLIKKRFGSKITFSLQVDENALDSYIPKLLIQPIVENAVHHGVEMKKGNGLVEMRIYKLDNTLHIEVKDNGLGIEEQNLLNIQNTLSNISSKNNYLLEQPSTKIGIINVHKRIRLLYGDEYGISLNSIYGEGTTISMTLPSSSDL